MESHTTTSKVSYHYSSKLMNIFGYIKVGKRISRAHQALFQHKRMVLWYKGIPIIGTMIDGKWYQADLNGIYEQLMFQSEVTHVSFLPSPYEGKDTHHRKRATKPT